MCQCCCGRHDHHAGHGDHHGGKHGEHGCGGHGDHHGGKHGEHGCGGHGESGHGGFVRRYISRQEQVEKLKKYKDDLEKELAGVTEQIAELEE